MTTINDLPNHLQDLIFSKMDKWEHIKSLIKSSTREDKEKLRSLQMLLINTFNKWNDEDRKKELEIHHEFYDKLYKDYTWMKKRNKELGIDRKMYLENKYGQVLLVKKCGKCLIIGNYRNDWDTTIKRGDEIKRYWIE